ncbi:APC family permease [bacterium 210820-DFI.6.37]|nr:APC family permease [bacterium 210820-DFI.6.37]
MKDERNRLSKVLGRTDVLAIGFGTMVGWSWIVLATTWLTQAGFWGTISAFLIGGLIILGVGTVYGELTSALPLAGGEIVYTYRAMGGKVAWIVGWIMTFAYLGVAAWEGIALATALDSVLSIGLYFPLWEIAGYTVHFSWALIGMLGAVVILLLNLFSSRPAVLFQVMATAAVVLLALMIFFGGITFGNAKNIGEGLRSLDGFFYVFLMVPSMLIGFNVIPLSAEEMNISSRGIGKMVLVCIAFSIIWYLVVITGLALCAPVEVYMSGTVPAADVISYAYSDDTFGTILILGGILGILTSWNGFFMGATRMIFSMGRAKMLPERFGRLHPKYNSPWAATILVGAVCIAAPLLGRNALVWFVDISSFCSLFAYCCVCMSFVILRKKEPELHRPFKVPFGTCLGVLLTCFSIVYFVIYIQDAFGNTAAFSRLILTGIWLLLGLALALRAKREFGKITLQERELLIFGEKLARRDLK